MKVSNKNNVLMFAAGAVMASGICLSICSTDGDQPQLQRKPLVPSVTMSPEVPKQITFCDKTYDLTRYNRHESMDRELCSFTYFHSTTMLLFKRANRYFPIIEPILKEEGIPDDFKYLAVIESHLDPRVTSPARAVGTWQLMEATGKEYGLTINTTVDERCDVAKATRAACKYLKDAYEKYGDWAMTAASYNAGMGRISSEKNRQEVDNVFDLWLVEETSRYVFRIFAIKQIFEAPYQYGFVLRPSDLYKPLEGKKITVDSDISNLAAYAKENGVTYADLKRMNPWLRNKNLVTGGKTYELLLPDLDDLSYRRPNSYVHNPAWTKGGFITNKLTF